MPRPSPPATAKMVPPRLHQLVPRGRLFEVLASQPISWISAAPGAGKTTLAASYCEQRGLPVLWYQVDAADADPANFFFFMRQAAARAGVARPARLPLLPPESAGEIGAFARRYFRTLFAALPAHTTLVLDNVQEGGGDALAGILREAFEQLPPGLAFIAISTDDPPPALARLLANGRLARVEPQALRFTRAESDALVLQRLQTAAPAALAALHERCAGWAAGLVLMVDHLARAGRTDPPTLHDSESAAFDYFAGQILDACSAEERRALLLAATLPSVTPRLVRAMEPAFDERRVEALLDRLHRHRLFVDRGPGGGEPHFQFHRLFKAFLVARARQELPAGERQEAAQRAALQLEADGCADDAIAMYQAGGSGEGAARLILRHAEQMVRDGRWRTLLDWMAALPKGRGERTEPWLLYWTGACLVWSDPVRSQQALEAAHAGFVAQGDLVGRILCAAVISRACMLGADWRQTDRWIAELESLLGDAAASAPPHVQLVGASRLLYVMLARQSANERLAHWADRTASLLGEAQTPNDAVMAGFSLLFYCTWTGQTALGDHVVRQLVPLAGAEACGAVSRTYWLWALGNFTLRTGEPLVALATIDEALDLAGSLGLPVAGVIRRHRVAHLLTLGRLKEAEAELDALAGAPRVEPYFELRAWAARARARFDAALAEAGAALRQAQERGRTFYELHDQLLLAQIHAARGDAPAAATALREYRTLTAGMPGVMAEVQAAWVEAFIVADRGEDEADAALTRACDLGARHRLMSGWGLAADDLVPLLQRALERGIGAAYVRDLIRVHRLAPRSPDVEGWPWPVRVRALGPFEVLLDGQPLRFEGKAQRRPLELLKRLLAAGGTPLAIDRVVDLLWPDPDEGGRRAFDVTVHRLRRLLGLDAAVEVIDRHVRLDPCHVWVDAWALDRLLEAVGDDAAGDGTRLEATAPRVLHLLAGAFLDGEPESPWVLAMRHRLSGRLRRFAERLGAHWEREHAWPRAAALYQRVIELEPLAELFYRREMACLQAQGRRAEAMEVFRRCRQQLALTLGVPPSEETQAAYRRLLDEAAAPAGPGAH